MAFLKTRVTIVAGAVCILLCLLSFPGCQGLDGGLSRSMKALYGWVDGMAHCPAEDAAVESHMAALPNLFKSLQDALQKKTPDERDAALLVLRQYMRDQFPTMAYDFTDAQLTYVVFGVKRLAWQLEKALNTAQLGGMTGAAPFGQHPTQEQWHQFVAQVYDLNGNGVPDANDPSMKGVRDDHMGLPFGFSPYDHSGLLRHLAGDVGAAARYHGLVAVDQEIPVFASVAEAAAFLAANPYRQPYVDIPQEKAATAAVDTDKDGLSDTSENNGWYVSVFDGVVQQERYKVTSDPNDPDTDDDGLLDSEEQRLALDPRNEDTDADGINDCDEVNVYGTNGASMDTDNDCRGYVINTQVGLVTYEFVDCDQSLYDGSELINSIDPTSAKLWDTDGDGRSDRNEIYQGRSALVADLPQLQVQVLGAPQLVILDTQGKTYSKMDQQLDSKETTHETSTTSSWNIGGKLSGGIGMGVKSMESGTDAIPDGEFVAEHALAQKRIRPSLIKKPKGSGLSKSLGFEIEGGYSHAKTTSDTTTTKVENMHQTIETHSQDISGYTLKAQVKVTNVSNTPISATVTKLVINCVYQIPEGDTAPGVGYLEMTPSSAWTNWVLGPGASTTLDIAGTENSASAAEEITNVIGSGAPITFTVAQCAMTATNGSAVANIMENVAQQASAITLDFGPYDPNGDNSATNHKPEAYYVATNVVRNGDDGAKTGMSLADALALAGVTDYTMDADGTLTQIQGWPANPADHPNGFWFLAGSSDSLVPDPDNPGYATYASFDTIWLVGANPKISSKPDFIGLYWMDDRDDDGLMDTAESSYGTDPTKKDTDGDGLTDEDEVTGVQSGRMVYFTNPLMKDSDGDGLSDYDEINKWNSNPVKKSSLVFNSLIPTCSDALYYLQSTFNVDSNVNVYPGDFDGDGVFDFIRQPTQDGENWGWSVAVAYKSKRFIENFATSAWVTVGNDTSIDPEDWFRYDKGCRLIPGDFDGNGRCDFLRQEKGKRDDDTLNTVQLYTSSGKQDSIFNKTDFTTSGDYSDWNDVMRYDKGAYIFAGDFNGDGATDVIRQEHGDWGDDDKNTAVVYYAAKPLPTTNPVFSFTGYFITATGALSDPQHDLRADPGVKLTPGDFDGDGKCDFFMLARNGWADNTTNNAGIYFATSVLGKFRYVEVTSTGYYKDPQSQLKYDDGADVIPGDFNGDKKCDFLRQERGNWANDGKDTLLLYIGNGDGSFVSTKVNTTGYFTNPDVELSGNICKLTVADFNGDGHDDFMRRIYGTAGDGTDNVTLYYSGYGN